MAKAAANKKPDILHTISEATSGLAGKDLLEELCRNFTRALNMQFALIAECTEEGSTQVRTLCMVNGDSVMDNIEYDTTGRPCELILQGKEIFVPKDVYKKFPEARGIEAATGVPIHSSVTGKIIGHIIISNLQPVTEESNQTTILKIFASRIGAEIERMKAEKKLEKKNAELHQRLYEIELYDTTLKNLREQVYWLNSDGKFIRVNAAVSRETGYSEDELHKMTVFDVNPTLTREEWDAHWKETKQLGHQVLETEHQSKDGRRYPVEVTNNFLEHDGHEYFCSTVRDIRQRKMEEELLRTVSEATSGLTGEDFLVELARHITITLKMRYALITECANEEKTRLRTLCYVDGEKILDNIEYDTAGIPCEIIMTGREFFMARDVQLNYPKEKGIESAVGVPIYSSKTGEVIGHILALDPQPVTTEKNQTSILKIFAARIGAEMERMKAEEKLKIANAELQVLLKESDQRYRDLFEEAPIAYVHEGLDSKFIKANRAALRILGVRPDEVPYTYGKTLAPDTPDAQRRLKEAFDSIGRGTDTSGVVLELRRKDNGKPIWIQWWSNPDAGGQFTRTMFVDITDKVLMEQEQARLQAQNKYLQEEIKLTYNFEEIISKSNNFQKVLQQIEQVAATDSTVLILGESGTGKELIARAVHNVSNRSKRPLVKVNCATLPANLIESELFGHEKGAFTGAMERKIGRFELADGGSIFLDEIGELPVELQAKLLRVLQEGEFERLGNPKTMKVNVRVIAATNRNLQQAIEKKEFREDLYYRLNVFPIICPPLRKRKEDIPLLIKHFCQKHEGKIGKKVTNVPADVIEALMAYDWPGNIRELENIIERAMILSRNGSLEYGDWIPTEKMDDSTNGATSTTARLEDVEKEHIIEILKKTGWKVSGEKGAAKILGLNATTLEARMKKLGIKRETPNR
ncbi:sigma-54-dependent Fis family transcriptional regulator [Terrimonas pollutisoli]|uniref:sigma-54-dependent Fis family transcriptional regulator n=1 Tax=Terrimonas pollutisoli TaxID=3034147 RepID=UPI0023ED1610|nr:sigma 54-interacting transcriptional regulator [Terrimonas sp. H1YJ31]